MYISGGSSGNYITGMASGMDVDTMVKELMDAERIPYDNYEIEKQYYEWQLEAYQESAGTISDFQTTYFDFLNPSTNMLSSSTYESYNYVYSSDGVSAVVTNSNISNSHYSLEVDQLATSAVASSDQSVSASINAANTVDYGGLDNQMITVTLDGYEKEVTIMDMDGSTDISLNDIQLVMDEAFGSGKILVEENGGKLGFDTATDSGCHELILEGDLTALGFVTDKVSNRLDVTDSLKDLNLKTPMTFDEDGMVNMKINGVDLEFSEDASLDYVMKTISEKADVKMTYNALSDEIMIETNQTGSGKTLSFSETGSNLLDAFSMTTVQAGQDLTCYVDGEKLVRSENTFETDGVVFSVTEVGSVDVDISFDSDQLFDTIVKFVDDYNTMVTDFQDTLKEERDYDYKPLTYAQKESMSDEEIELWESQAKVGLLDSDDLLEDMLEEMRRALYMPVEGCSLTLAEIGITTDGYESGSKLVIDEDKLKSAIETSSDEIVELFTKPSESYPGTTSARSLTSDEKAVRQSEEGLMYRLYDVTEKYISSTSDSMGNKGILIEKCGYKDDYSELNSTMYQQLQGMEDNLLRMEEDLEEKETNYYMEFSAMETYISSMNSQLQMIQSWFV
ncbi:flagellar hook protein [Acidaminobacter sp. JC074]|uniref:flagellar filament capping protein FliD n=1 Tax=Acidaminobacter sp. JC074 TaxID=2530199 RepID=UPI001F10E3C1|nr:flagellar filament capping protein FliD [Acidaminobacter sp. JC074]MCH4887438.1 flagellar hook protein [Acidaminobacter sp. JC074]